MLYRWRSSAIKLREAVRFVSRKITAELDKPDAPQLHKILWCFDVRSYVATGKSVTGTVYVRREFGPYAREISSAVDELLSTGQLHMDGDQPTGSVPFSERELHWLNEITKDARENGTATSIREKWHESIWRMAAIGEEIPFAATAVSLRAPSGETVELARQDLRIAP